MKVNRSTNIVSFILAAAVIVIAVMGAIKIINPESSLFNKNKSSKENTNISTTDQDLAKKYFLIPEMGLKIKYTNANKKTLDDLAYALDSKISGFDTPIVLGSKSYTTDGCTLSDAPLGKLEVISLASVDDRADASIVKANSIQVGANYIYYAENLSSCYRSADKAKYPDVEEMKLIFRDPQQLLPY